MLIKPNEYQWLMYIECSPWTRLGAKWFAGVSSLKPLPKALWCAHKPTPSDDRTTLLNTTCQCFSTCGLGLPWGHLSFQLPDCIQPPCLILPKRPLSSWAVWRASLSHSSWAGRKSYRHTPSPGNQISILSTFRDSLSSLNQIHFFPI